MEHQRLSAPRGLSLAVGIAAAVGFAHWLALAWLAKPFADDYCLLQSVREHGWWEAQQVWWHGISGRFAGNAVITGVGPVVDAGVGLWTATSAFYTAILAGFAVLGWRLVDAALPGLAGRERFALSALAALALILAMPRSTDILFWITGAAMNALPAFYLAGAALALLRLTLQGWLPGRVAVCLYAAGAPFAAGLHESVFPLLAILLAAIVWSAPRRPVVLGAAAVLVLAAAGFALLYAAPGNARRMAEFADSGRVVGTIVFSLDYFASYVVLRLLAMPALFGWLAAALLAGAHDGRAARWAPIAILGGAFLLSGWAMFGIGYYGMGGDLPHRTKDLLFVLVFVLLTGIAVALGRIGRSWLLPRRRWAAVAAALLIATNFDLWRAPWTLFVTGPRFAAEVEAQAAAAESGSPTVPRIATRPRLLFLGDLPDRPASWHNVCYGSYFGRPSVVPE